MANLLENALPPILSLLPLSPITIINKEKVLVDGFSATKEIKIDTFALIQPYHSLTPIQSSQSDMALLNTEIVYKFYFTKNLVEVINFLENKDSVLIYNDNEYQVYAKEDWSANGWIKVVASLSKKVENEGVNE